MSIVATMTNDQELLAAAVLHDVIEDTDTTADDLRREFGERIAMLVEAESDVRMDGSKADSWHRRKQAALDRLTASGRDVKIVALGDKLSNMRAIARDFVRYGDDFWKQFHAKDPQSHAWRFRALVDAMSELKGLEAYEEFASLVECVFSKACAGKCCANK